MESLYDNGRIPISMLTFYKAFMFLVRLKWHQFSKRELGKLSHCICLFMDHIHLHVKLRGTLPLFDITPL